MSSFSTSLSGLNADEEALSVISNDLSNLNTTAFKAGSPIFSDLFYQMLGSDGAGDPVQVGVGATMTSIASPITQGNISTTGVPTDAAIEGDGFFILNQAGGEVYTRAGDFTLNSQGYLVDSNGANVMGYPAVNGVIAAAQSLAPLTIPIGQVFSPKATSSVELDMNLDAADAAGATATGTLTLAGAGSNGQTATIGTTTYTFVTALSSPAVPDQVLIGAGAAGTLADLAAAINGGAGSGTDYSSNTQPNSQVTATASAGTLTLTAVASGSAGNNISTATNLTGGSFASGTLTGGVDGGSFSTPVTVYDSLGQSHVLTFTFNKTGTGAWSYQITIPAADVGGAGNPHVVTSGTLQFDANGNLTSPAANIAGINVSALADGASTLSFTWNLYNSSKTPVVTQTAENSTASTTQDGYGAGSLQSYTFGSSGIITGSLSNGQTVTLGQIALATFPNSDGLVKLGQNQYEAGVDSGVASAGAPGSGGRGTIEGQALEQSNVDIATELTQLILAERGYEANAKAITTADTLMQTAINLKQ